MKAHNRASTLETDTSFEEDIATRLFNTNSPVENTPTGYQHLRLRFEGYSFRPGSSSHNDRSQHEVCHNELCNTLGLWIFCKLSAVCECLINVTGFGLLVFRSQLDVSARTVDVTTVGDETSASELLSPANRSAAIGAIIKLADISRTSQCDIHIDLAIHAPMSLGELVDTVSQELSSRCNSVTHKYNVIEQGQRNDGFASSLQTPSADLVQSGIEGEM
ncbi:hypothetical protein CSKR_113288 [Clonorchis sinensis]|uniref:Uncharacterized protein n=1 Tax=Clonorchis sinensis TaxID=79923 RepID=A0A419PGA4_CLOSI|nr:hypothetical protein CSKR_113288 [Clonorchis sinensis]